MADIRIRVPIMYSSHIRNPNPMLCCLCMRTHFFFVVAVVKERCRVSASRTDAAAAADLYVRKYSTLFLIKCYTMRAPRSFLFAMFCSFP